MGSKKLFDWNGKVYFEGTWVDKNEVSKIIKSRNTVNRLQHRTK